MVFNITLIHRNINIDLKSCIKGTIKVSVIDISGQFNLLTTSELQII